MRSVVDSTLPRKSCRWIWSRGRPWILLTMLVMRLGRTTVFYSYQIETGSSPVITRYFSPIKSTMGLTWSIHFQSTNCVFVKFTDLHGSCFQSLNHVALLWRLAKGQDPLVLEFQTIGWVSSILPSTHKYKYHLTKMLYEIWHLIVCSYLDRLRSTNCLGHPSECHRRLHVRFVYSLVQALIHHFGCPE